MFSGKWPFHAARLRGLISWGGNRGYHFSPAFSLKLQGLIPLRLETRTRFKEDCDQRCRASPARHRPIGWKPGLASKRIATALGKLVGNVGKREVGNQDSLQRGLRQESLAPRQFLGRPVGNQDSLQRGLRLISLNSKAFLSFLCWKPGLASKRIATWPPARLPS